MPPYIPQEDRDHLEHGAPIQKAGELNYLFTQHIDKYLADHGLNYSVINDIIGALEGAKLEFYSRIVAPYEVGAKNRNGDVYHQEEWYDH